MTDSLSYNASHRIIGHKNCAHPANGTKHQCCVRVGKCLSCKWDVTPKTEDHYLDIDVDKLIEIGKTLERDL